MVRGTILGKFQEINYLEGGEDMRATTHNGRIGKNGAFSARHNDRNFDITTTAHINQDKSDGNYYWHWLQAKRPELTFEEAERLYYEEHFADGLKAKNEGYARHGNNRYIQTMDEYRKNPRSCPEETILMIGKMGDTVSPNVLKNICLEYMRWQEKTFPNVKILDFAIHTDESTVHAHLRSVWIGHDKNGNEIIGQNKALEEMNIPLQALGKARSRYNNRKQTYTAICRKKFIEICNRHGLEIENKPLERSKTGMSQNEYIAQQEKEKADSFIELNKRLLADCDRLKVEKAALEHERSMIQNKTFSEDFELNRLSAQIEFKQIEYNTLKQAADQLLIEAREAEQARKKIRQILKDLERLKDFLSEAQKAEVRKREEEYRAYEEGYDYFCDYDDR